MVAIKGILKVRVVQGIDLAIRDFFSSDPYVKLRIADHRVRTRVIRSSLNPRWDEELTLGTSDPPELLKLLIYNKNALMADDKMGEAQIDLNPLVRIVKRKDSYNYEEDGIIGHVPATSRNGFVRASAIKLNKGQIVQKMRIRLKNVESGEIKLQLTWQPSPGSVREKSVLSAKYPRAGSEEEAQHERETEEKGEIFER